MSQVNALNHVKEHSCVVGSIDSEGYFSLASRPFFHPTAAEASKECQRLALAHPGKAFVAMYLAGGSITSTLVNF
jgi:hypothetical protein